MASYRLAAKIFTSQRGEGRVRRWRGSDLVEVASLVFRETIHVKHERIVLARDALPSPRQICVRRISVLITGYNRFSVV